MRVRPRVYFKIANAELGIASVRYRALLPALALQEMSFRCTVTDDAACIAPRRGDVVVIVKSFGSADRELASRAERAQARVVLDLCDNIFVPGYVANSILPPAMEFMQLARHAQAIVVSTDALRTIVRQQVGANALVLTIPDGLETPSLFERERRLLAAAPKRRLSRWLRRLREVLGQWRRWFTDDGPRPRRRKRRRAPDRAAARSSPDREGLYIVWFGNHGARYAQFGIGDILLFREALARAAQEFGAELVVVSNDAATYHRQAPFFGIASHFVCWSPQAMKEWLGRAAVVIIPNSLDPFSICKSANRSVLALQAGVPVVATPTEAIAELAPAIWTQDPYLGLRTYLTDAERVAHDVATGRELIAQRYSLQRIGRLWGEVLERVAGAAGTAPKPRISALVVIGLEQDWDIALPIIDALRQAAIGIKVVLSERLCREGTGRVIEALHSAALPIVTMTPRFPMQQAEHLLAGADAVLTCAESTLGPHLFAHRLVKFARSQGIPSFTTQHGFENVGLTYSDAVHPIETIRILSSRIFIWGTPETLHPAVAQSVRARCISVGCPKPARVARLPLPDLEGETRPIVGVCENLHWHRYSDDYRRNFMAAIDRLAQRHRDVLFLVKPHHAGRWLARREGERQGFADNVRIIDPAAPAWRAATAPQLFGYLCAIITTPSTVALDAARHRLPVCVAQFDLDLDNYAPLTRAADGAALERFVADVLGGALDAELERGDAFAAHSVLAGDAAQRIVGVMLDVINERRPHGF